MYSICGKYSVSTYHIILLYYKSIVRMLQCQNEHTNPPITFGLLGWETVDDENHTHTHYLQYHIINKLIKCT